MSRIQQLYVTVESALWAGLVAFVLFFIAVVAPHIAENRFKQEAIRLHAEAAEYDAYCEKLDKRAGTREHALCVLELQEFRAEVIRQYANANGF